MWRVTTGKVRCVMIKGEITKTRMEGWKFCSNETEGFHEVIAPGKADCEEVFIYRLNLSAGSSFVLDSKQQEMNAACIVGACRVKTEAFDEQMNQYDSFYVTADTQVEILAEEDLILYIGAAMDEGYGKPFFRKFDINLPLGEIHQIHGQGVGEREVFMTVNPEAPASRILAGLTWSRNGAWTSWPPHQHEKDLEEAYCYFGMPAPQFGMHLSYINPGDVDNIVVHTVKSGTMILAPRGYHPTVASPGTLNAYFWVLAAHSHESRRYDLAILDPEREEMN